MTAKKKLVAVAAGEVGVKESPAGSNRVKYNTWFYGREVSGSSYPWCCAFVCWCFHEAGMDELIRKTGGCTTMMNYFKGKGRLVPTRQAQPGDLVFYQFDKDSYADHIGIVEKVNKTGVTAIEGNTSLTSNDNGGAVMRRSRRWGLIMAVARPDYESVKEEAEMTEKDVKALVAEMARELSQNIVQSCAEVKAALEPKRYHKVADLPWGWDAVERLRAAGIIQGDGKNEISLTDADLVTVAMVDKLRLEFLIQEN